MKTQAQARESSVVLALAELDTLERSRQAFVDEKRALLGESARQGEALDELKARLEAERPRARARRRDRKARGMAARREAAQVASQERARAHDRRMAVHAAELEAKRLELAKIEALPVVATPGRKLLEWTTPFAAAAMIAMLFAVVTHEDEAAADETMMVSVDETPSAAAAFAGTVLVPLAAEAPEAPEAPAKATSPSKKSSTKKSSTKKSSTNKSSTKKSSTKKTPASKVPGKRGDPLVLKFGDDPLG